MAIFLAGKAVCYRILAFFCYGKLHFKCESADLGLGGSGLQVRRKAKRSSENLISKFSDDLLFSQRLLVGFITFEGKEDDVEVAHG